MENERPVVALTSLAAVLLALLLLTAASVAVSRLDTGDLRIFAALGIAAVKTALVLLFFMHLGRAGRVVTLAFLATVSTLAVFIALTFTDIMFR